MKLPFSFSIKLVFRLLLPGAVIALAIFLIAQTILGTLSVKAPAESVLAALVIISGWMTTVLDMHIYMLYEGRRVVR